MNICKKCGFHYSDDHSYCMICGIRVDGMKDCQKCQKVIKEESVYCPYCGIRTDVKKVCQCGEILEPDTMFCPKCGISKKNQNKPSKTIKLARTFDLSLIKENYLVELITKCGLILFSLIILLTSFFTTIKMEIPIDSGTDIVIKQSGTQFLGALFSIGNGYDENELMDLIGDISENLEEYMYDEYPPLEALGKEFSKINYLKLMITDDKVLANVTGSLPEAYFSGAEVSVIIYGLLILSLMIGNAVFIVLLTISIFKKDKTKVTVLSPLLNFATALIFIFVLMPSLGVSVGVAVKMPLILSIVYISLEIIYSIVVNFHHIDLKRIISKGSVALVSLIIVLIVSFAPSNKLDITYDNSFNKSRIHTVDIRNFHFLASYTSKSHNSTFTDLYTNSNTYISNKMADYLTGDIIFPSLGNSNYLYVYEAFFFLYYLMPIVYLAIVIILFYIIISNIYRIIKNEYKRTNSLLLYVICGLLVYSLATNIFFMLSVNETISSLKLSDSLKIRLSGANITSLVLTLGLVAYTIFLKVSNMDKDKEDEETHELLEEI